MSVAAAMVAALVTAGPAPTASAVNRVPCGDRHDLVEVVWHTGGNQYANRDCGANRGTLVGGSDVWVNSISTGNNVVEFADFNGAVIRIGKWRTGLWTVASHGFHQDPLDRR